MFLIYLLILLQGTVVSMAVPSDGSYGVPQGLVFSFPVICRNGEYLFINHLFYFTWFKIISYFTELFLILGNFKIVQGFQLDAFSNKLIAKTTTELVEERDMAQSFMKK